MGVVLGIYLGTVLTSYAVAYLDDKVTKAKLDREGYIDTTKQSTPEKIKDLIHMFLLCIMMLMDFLEVLQTILSKLKMVFFG